MFITDIVQSFLKFSSLSFSLFLVLSAVSLPDGFKDVASMILLLTVVWERKSRACILGALTLVLFVILVIIVVKLFSAIRSGVASPLERCSRLLTRLMIPSRLVVIAINEKRANSPVYQRYPLPPLDVCMPQPVNTFCLVPTSLPVWHRWLYQET